MHLTDQSVPLSSPRSHEQRRRACCLCAGYGHSVSRLSVYPVAVNYTAKQGQYLAFIYYYTKLNGRAPSEADMERYFSVTPPSVHQMVLTLESRG